MTSNAVPPSVTPPSPFEWPQDTIKDITGITRDGQAMVTVVAHGFDVLNENTTFVTFKQVQGMRQINGLDALITKVLDDDNIRVNINTTGFYDYLGGGVLMVLSGLPPREQQGFQVFNTPFQNIANQI